MKTLKRMMVALLALLPLATGMAVADTEHGYDHVFIFGASFMDSGNHFVLTGETAHVPFGPLGPSYPMGGYNFSNGPTWVEVLAAEMKLTHGGMPAYRNPVFGNYAVGYARARDVAPDPLEPSLYDQVAAWDGNGYCTGNPTDRLHDTLFVMDSAYFDALDLLQAPDDQSDEILGGWLASISNNIHALYLCGAHNMLVPYLPDMGSAPGIPPESKAAATEASFGFNYFFLQSIVDFYNGPPFNMNITTVDFFALTTMVLATPEEYGFTNMTDSCVAFGVTNGAFCKDRDSYFFWDPLHPSRSAHALMAEFALPQLPVAE